jgi:hypothetical protein
LSGRAPTACTHTVSGSISLPSPGFFSPFPHGTGSLSVNWEYLALEDGPPIFSQDNTCPDLLGASSVPQEPFRVRGYHPVSPHFPERSTKTPAITCRLLPFRSPLLRESRLISFPTGTEMFQFPAFASSSLCIQPEDTCLMTGGFPHSDIAGSQVGCHLPDAFRRLQRPSSPPIAKASTVCASSLDHIIKQSINVFACHRRLKRSHARRIITLEKTVYCLTTCPPC